MFYLASCEEHIGPSIFIGDLFMTTKKYILRWPFRVIGCGVTVLLITGFAKLIFELVTHKPSKLSGFEHFLALTFTPTVIFLVGFPSLYGYYPSWVGKLVPPTIQKIMKMGVVKVFSDWPWARNPDVVKELNKVDE